MSAFAINSGFLPRFGTRYSIVPQAKTPQQAADIAVGILQDEAYGTHIDPEALRDSAIGLPANPPLEKAFEQKGRATLDYYLGNMVENRLWASKKLDIAHTLDLNPQGYPLENILIRDTEEI